MARPEIVRGDGMGNEDDSGDGCEPAGERRVRGGPGLGGSWRGGTGMHGRVPSMHVGGLSVWVDRDGYEVGGGGIWQLEEWDWRRICCGRLP